jgi:uncharacterized membrane protein YqiK
MTFETLFLIAQYIVAGLLLIGLLTWLCGFRYIPHNRVGIVEKLWSSAGSLAGGRIVATQGEAGFQAQMLRGGVHLGFFPWQYRIHLQPLVTVSEGRIGYVYARDGAPLAPTQTLGRIVDSNHFQDAEAFLRAGGQRGRQRGVLREGMFAVNLAQFVVITEQRVFSGPIRESEEQKYAQWQLELAGLGAFAPVLIGYGERKRESQGEVNHTQLSPNDTIGVVTVHDGPPIESHEIIAPEVKAKDAIDHSYFQDPEAFLLLGGRRGKQLQVLTDGTFFINRWFATIEIHPKTLIPIGYVGVVVSYYGTAGEDVTGEGFRYGEQVEAGRRGVWKRALTPGKYPLNPYAIRVELVPTVNFVLRWITGQVEAHQYDKDLVSLDLITADGYEPLLPLSLVLHIDYEKAPRVIQRFGDVRRLISQTLDPILSAYFRDVAQSSSMLDLLTHREDIQRRATEELGRRFQQYDINCVAVLIGRPESKIKAGQADPIDRLFDQLRQRRLADEQRETFAKQEEAALHLKQLNDAQAAAAKQTELTQTKIDVEIAANRGEAALAESERLARRDVVRASGESQAQELLGKGEASRVAQVGLSEAAVFLNKIRAYGDPRLFALGIVAEKFANASQPIVPERVFLVNGETGDGAGATGGGAGSTNVFNQLVALLLAEKAGVAPTDGNATAAMADLERFAREITQSAARAAEAPGADAKRAETK